MPKILFLICLVGLPGASSAQSGRTSWSNLGALQAGQAIQVVDMNSQERSGTFLSVSETAIAYRDTAGEQTIQKQDVRSVKLLENRYRLRNSLIGAAAGAGTGAGIGAASWEKRGFLGGRGAGAAVGAAIGCTGGRSVAQPQNELSRQFALVLRNIYRTNATVDPVSIEKRIIIFRAHSDRQTESGPYHWRFRALPKLLSSHLPALRAASFACPSRFPGR